jgi:hypothetical protein
VGRPDFVAKRVVDRVRPEGAPVSTIELTGAEWVVAGPSGTRRSMRSSWRPGSFVRRRCRRAPQVLPREVESVPATRFAPAGEMLPDAWVDRFAEAT